jgi:hypothetical protein
MNAEVAYRFRKGRAGMKNGIDMVMTPMTRQVLISLSNGTELPGGCIFVLTSLQLDGYIKPISKRALRPDYRLTEKGIEWLKVWGWLHLTKPNSNEDTTP